MARSPRLHGAMTAQPPDTDGDEGLCRFVRAGSGDATARERLNLASWAGADPARHRELDEWSSLAAEVEALAPQYADEVRTLSRRRWRPVWAAAACLAGLGLAIVALGERTVTADQGRPAGIALRDGTHIHLDSGASLDLPYAPWRHSARLTRGTALFEIPHDDARPFVVQVGRAEIRDVGTRFLVERTDAGTWVAVFEGAVEVNPAPGTPVLPLAAGQAARVSEGEGAVRVAGTDESVAAGWLSGRLVFDDTPLAEVVARLARYQGQRVEIGSPEIAGLRLSGSFDIHSREALLRAVELALPVRVRRQGDVAVLVAAPR